MGMVFKIALRNIMRHKRRTLTSATVIAVGLLFYIFMDSVMAGLDRGGIDNMIELSTAAVKIHTRAYERNKEAMPLDHGIGDVAALERMSAQHEQVVGVTPRTSFLAQLSNYEETVPVVGTVIAPATDSAVFSLHSHLIGSYFSEHNEREIILGQELAQEMGVDTGGYITLYALTRYDSRNADEFRVVGLTATSDPNINRSSVIISYAAANDFLDLDRLVTEVDVGLKRRVNLADMAADAENVRIAVEQANPTLRASTFMEQAAAFLEIAKSKRSFGIGFLAIILLIAAVGIFNTVLMSVYERIREVGVLRAHGLRSNQVTLMFMLEGFFTGLIGSLIGLVLGSAVNWVLVVYGYPIDKLAGDIDTSGIPYWGTIYGEWNITALLLMFVFGITVSTLAAALPARKAARLGVTEALRFV